MGAVAQKQEPDNGRTAPSGAYAEIFGESLPEFDTVGGSAYAHLEDEKFYILVQDRNVPFRKTIIDGYNRIKASSLSDLRDTKILNTPQGPAACYIMQRPKGGKVFNGRPLGDRLLRSVLLPSILSTFKSLHDEGLSYRFLSPDRIYYETDQQDEIMLLESFSVPPGLQMPFSYESIAHGMVEPAARGEGTESDDYYALGVLITHLLTGRDPIGARSEQSYQQARMTQGSFAACLSGNGITGAVSALLRGLLQDDVEQRWGHRDVMNWLNGELRRAAPTNNTWFMPQPVSMAGRTITDRRALAAALQANPDAADSLYKRKTTIQWVAQIAPGSEAHQALANLMDFGNTTKRVDTTVNGQDAVLSRFCSLLDPQGPVRFRSLCLMPDGVGPFFAANYLQGNKEQLADLKTLMSGNIWHGLMEIRALMAGPESQVDQMNAKVNWLKDAQHINDGLERAFYALNEGLPCRTKEVGDAFVLTPPQLMRAIDKRCLQTTEGIKLDDKDLLAFLAARSPNVRRYILSLANMKPDQKNGILLKLFGELHLHYGSPRLKGLAKLFQNRFRKRINELRSKTRRDLLIKRVGEVVEEGDVSTLAKLVNIDRLMAADERGLAQARQKIKKLDRAMAFASRSISPADPTAIAKAAQISCYLGGFVVIGSLMFRFL
ncbi:MAG: hypothetical protein AAF221_08975 [Pseudomonadota bacterium]